MITIRPATADDAEAISRLIQSVAHFFTLDPTGKGAEKFLQTLSPTAIAGYVTAPHFCYLTAWLPATRTTEAQLVGVIALRDQTHVYHLFVASEHQNQGLARQLWQHVQQHYPLADTITVNASVYAVPVYQRFGFVIQGERREQAGIAFVPMAYNPQ